MAGERTHRVEVEGVGSFVFRRRTPQLQCELECRMERLTFGPVQSDWLKQFSAAIASLEVLTAEGPPKWDLDAVDPLDDEEFGKVFQVWKALREAEATFRRKPGTDGAIERIAA